MSLILALCAFLGFIDSVINWYYDKKKNKGILEMNMEELNVEMATELVDHDKLTF